MKCPGYLLFLVIAYSKKYNFPKEYTLKLYVLCVFKLDGVQEQVFLS